MCIRDSLIPDLGETEIFEPICQGMMASPLAREHALIWGSPSGTSKEERAWQLARQYIERKVSGVFFAPLELSTAKDDINERIARAFDELSLIHISEPTRLLSISYAVFCLKKK